MLRRRCAAAAAAYLRLERLQILLIRERLVLHHLDRILALLLQVHRAVYHGEAAAARRERKREEREKKK